MSSFLPDTLSRLSVGRTTGTRVRLSVLLLICMHTLMYNSTTTPHYKFQFGISCQSIWTFTALCEALQKGSSFSQSEALLILFLIRSSFCIIE